MKRYYIEQLTWLRGIAAFFVIVSHTIRASEIKYSPLDERSYFLPLGLIDLGSFGVALFFVLSGCTLWISNRNVGRGMEDILAFYTKRIFRIWPAYFISILFYMVFIEIFKLYYHGPKHPWIYPFINNSYSLTDVLRYLSLTFNITGPNGLFTGAYWSLPVEFQYYLIFPFLAFSTRLIKYLAPILIGIFIYILWIYEVVELRRYEVLHLAYIFCAGVSIGYLYTEKIIRLRLPPKIGFPMTAVAFFIASIVYNSKLLSIPIEETSIKKWDWYGLCAIASVFILLFTDFSKRSNFITKFLRLYGSISYSIYLFHGLIIGIAILLVTNYEIYGDSKKLFFIFIFTLFVSFFLSFYSYNLVELPGINLGKKLISLFSSGSNTPIRKSA